MTETTNIYPQVQLHQETQALMDAGTRLAEPHALEEGRRYVAVVPDGYLAQTIDNDLDRYRRFPWRKAGVVVVRDAASFVAYVGKHGMPNTELWADTVDFHVVGVINAHEGIDHYEDDDGEAATSEGLGGWGDHRVELHMIQTPAWKAWAALNNRLVSQVDFAEHIEQRLIDIVDPPGADMLELAQTFTAKQNVSYESSYRLDDGQTKLTYHEDNDAKAGSKGEIAIPRQFTIGIAPFEGGEPYKLTARLRYRIQRGGLVIGYVIERPEDTLKAAFDDVVEHINNNTTQPLFMGTPEHP